MTSRLQHICATLCLVLTLLVLPANRSIARAESAGAVEIISMTGHSREITSVAFSPGGTLQ